ncbi:MAG TPA: hypothetical protein PLI51_02875 [bacterium]|nr:hypothetical protein [bacterium]HPQ65661.1 hypothetical protein [bacterium]
MHTAQEILHENCRVGADYLIEMGGKKYTATFKGYRNNNQYAPSFEIVGTHEVRVLRQLD